MSLAASAAATSPRRNPVRLTTLSETGSSGVNSSDPPPTAACCDSVDAPASTSGRSKRALGAPGSTARSRSVTASSGVVSTVTSIAASAAASGVSAMTSATGWPAHRISCLASGSSTRSVPSVTIGRSAATSTATTPGTASAASRSIRSIRAWAGMARTGRAWSRPRVPISAAKRARPVTFGPPSTRGIERPIALVSGSMPPGSRTSCGPFHPGSAPSDGRTTSLPPC